MQNGEEARNDGVDFTVDGERPRHGSCWAIDRKIN